MNIKGAIIAGIVGGLLGAGTPSGAHAGDAEKGKSSKGQKNACGGKNGCQGSKSGGDKTDTGKKS